MSNFSVDPKSQLTFAALPVMPARAHAPEPQKDAQSLRPLLRREDNAATNNNKRGDDMETDKQADRQTERLTGQDLV